MKVLIAERIDRHRQGRDVPLEIVNGRIAARRTRRANIGSQPMASAIARDETFISCVSRRHAHGYCRQRGNSALTSGLKVYWWEGIISGVLWDPKVESAPWLSGPVGTADP